MKIALLGYGRMGKAIEALALKRGHEVVLRVDEYADAYDITVAEVAIDFSIPAVAVSHITQCIENGVPVVSGTTGWLERFDEMVQLCEARGGSFIYASNFSLGVNLFFELNRSLARLMREYGDYDLDIEEIHHTGKLDAPSGTAISLAEGIIDETDKKAWVQDVTNRESTIPIVSKRIPEVPGTHTVSYTSDVDRIDITHTAHSRTGFALGAVIAAEWLLGKKGVFSMRDVLGLNTNT